jgi:hypothetical protein
MHMRVKQAGEATLVMLSRGLDVLSPIVHGHFLESVVQKSLPAERWYDLSMSLVMRCSEVWVLTLPGWEESKGIRIEVDVAKKLGKPVIFKSFSDILGNKYL